MPFCGGCGVDVTGQLACGGCGRQTKLGRETAAALEAAQQAVSGAGSSLEISNCHVCGKPVLATDNRVETLDGARIFHESCHAEQPEAAGDQEQYSCAGCSKPIEDGAQILNAMDACWHVECLKCSVCGTLLAHEAQGFCDRDGQAICVLCDAKYVDQLIQQAAIDNDRVCAGCDRPIVEEMLEVQGAKWHPGCYKCSSCATPLESQAKLFEGNVYCGGCIDSVRDRAVKMGQAEALQDAGFIAQMSPCPSCGQVLVDDCVQLVSVQPVEVLRGSTTPEQDEQGLTEPDAVAAAPQGSGPGVMRTGWAVWHIACVLCSRCGSTAVQHEDARYAEIRGEIVCEPCVLKWRQELQQKQPQPQAKPVSTPAPAIAEESAEAQQPEKAQEPEQKQPEARPEPQSSAAEDDDAASSLAAAEAQIEEKKKKTRIVKRIVTRKVIRKVPKADAAASAAPAAAGKDGSGSVGECSCGYKSNKNHYKFCWSCGKRLVR